MFKPNKNSRCLTHFTLWLYPSVGAFLRFCPAGYFSCSIAFLQQSHSVQCCTVHLSHILRVIKSMFESQVWRNLQNVPCGQKKVFLSAERDITDPLFIPKHIPCQNKDNTVNLRLSVQSSHLFSLNRNQYGCSISYTSYLFIKQQRCLQSLGSECFLYFDGLAVKRGWQCLPSLRNDTCGGLKSREFCTREDEEQHCCLLWFNMSDHMKFSK